ncbi:helix-turn-helix domain-containing protein [Propionibacterium australiense]|uniref:helix-turn-helix domain-containing protein n=1 Tax=Propionibacterium australiense TaxID=119981 RepID=UPI00160296FE
MLTVVDRAAIAKGLDEGCSFREIARRIGRDVSVVSREVKRSSDQGRYRCVAADTMARQRRRR